MVRDSNNRELTMPQDPGSLIKTRATVSFAHRVGREARWVRAIGALTRNPHPQNGAEIAVGNIWNTGASETVTKLTSTGDCQILYPIHLIQSLRGQLKGGNNLKAGKTLRFPSRAESNPTQRGWWAMGIGKAPGATLLYTTQTRAPPSEGRLYGTDAYPAAANFELDCRSWEESVG